MTDFDDFWVVLTHELQPGAGNNAVWNVELADCPLPAFKGHKGSINLTFTPAQLKRLRSREGWPNPAELQEMGKNVWSSLMTPDLNAAYIACRDTLPADRGLRFVLTITGAEPSANNGSIFVRELPIEALYSGGYLAPNRLTPISRGLKFAPDRDPQKITLPLRILVVVATPSDKPKAKMADELGVIQKALKLQTGAAGNVEIEFCKSATRKSLRNSLSEKSYHILHFIGHGAFEDVGNDIAVPHICLERSEKNRESDPVDAQTLDTILLNSGVRLLVLTACASASPTPEEVGTTISPFDGLAQAIVAGSSGVNAVVGMQFDLEETAARVFSEKFYAELLNPDRKLDEVVALCRQSLASELNAGHRAWVTPVVYSRCKGGKVFDVVPLKRPIDAAIQKQLDIIEANRDTLLDFVSRQIDFLRPSEKTAAAGIIDQLSSQVSELDQKRGELLGETVRLLGGIAQVGASISCALTIRLRKPTQVGDVSVHISYPEDKLTLTGVEIGKAVTGDKPFHNEEAGQVTILTQNTSAGKTWGAGEFELAVLTFEVATHVAERFLEIDLQNATVEEEGIAIPFDVLDAVLFVSQP